MSATLGNDTLTGTAGDDVIDLLTGDDSYLGLDGNDSIRGGFGADRFIYNSGGNDSIDGGNGADRIDGGEGDDSVVGGDGNDTVLAGGGNDLIEGGNGDDDLSNLFRFGSNRMFGGAGNDILNSATNSTLSGDGGDDTLIGTPISAGIALGAFSMAGGEGNDSVTLGASYGTAQVTGGNGNDVLSVGAGVETVDAGAGNDTIIAHNTPVIFSEGADSYMGGSGIDLLSYEGLTRETQGVTVNLAASVTSGSLGNDSLSGIENVLTGAGNDSVLGDGLANVLSGGDGDDTLAGGNGDDRLTGGNGADRLDGGAGNLDTADYSDNTSTQGISVNLALGTADDGLGFTDALVSIEFIRGGAGNDFVMGRDANDRFRGNAGSDTFDGGNGSEDILDLSQTSASVTANLGTGRADDGLLGNDSFVGVEVVYSGTAADTLTGGAGNDIFDGGMGGDLINGGLGADRVRYFIVSGNNGSITRGVSVDLAAQRATDGWGGADTLVGIERVTATNFADTLLGDNVSNRLGGLAGNDSFDGGLGSDWLEYSDGAATSGVTVNLTTGTASDGRGGTDSFTSMENVSGGTFGDHLTGTAQGGRATSRLRGAAGSDTLVGIDGEFVVADYADQTVGLSVNLASGSVNDGLGGVDQLVNIRGAMMFGSFADTLIGTNSTNWLAPSGGNDSIVGGSGTDILDYDGNPTGGVSVNLASRTAADGDGGTDFFTGIEAVKTGYSNDTVIGDDGDNFISLGAGADFADAAGGRDFISYAVGFGPNASVYTFNEAANQLPFTGVTIDLAAGRATDYGGSVDTILNFEYAEGSSMHDSILGSSSDNELEGAEGNDTINGGAGNDTIWKGPGNDLLMGDAGNDLYRVDAATGRVIIDDASGNDTVDFGGVAGREIFTSDISSMAGIEAFDLVGSGNTLHLTAARALSVSGTGLFRVFGGGADMLVFDDTGWLRTGSSGGFDTLSNSAGNATVIASSGIVLSEPGAVVNGGDGNDTLSGGNGADTIDGGNGSDIIAGFGGNDTILGGSGDDSIDAGNGDDTVLRSFGNDLIQGGNGNDNLSGAGRSRLFGGDGNDILKVEFVEAGTLMGDGGDDTLIGTPMSLIAASGAFSLAGGEGNDSVTLGASYMTAQVTGGNGDDVLSVGAGFEAVDAGIGNDTIIAHNTSFIPFNDGADSYMGGSGIDLLSYEGLTNATQGVTVNLAASVTSGSLGNDSLSGIENVLTGAGNDSVLGDGLANVLSGGNGNDSILGNDGDDTIYGGNGADRILGGAGNDRIYAELGDDSVDAGSGTQDRIFYNQDGGAAIIATIASSGGSSGVNRAIVTTASQGNDTLQGFEILFASSGADSITVSSAATAIDLLHVLGLGGNDTLVDAYGQNGVFANYSSPNVTGGIFVDLSTGVATDGFGGTDSLVGFTAVNATSFADTLVGSNGNDRFRGLEGNDCIMGGNGAQDMIDYNYLSASSQAVSVNLATGRANDGMGFTDTLISIEQARGGPGNDVLIGDSNDNTFRGNRGSDTIDGAGGTADAADYALAGAAVSVNLATGQAQDGQGGNDSLIGIENVFGSAYADTLIGSNGNDNLRGGDGNDMLSGGAGNDVAIYSDARTAYRFSLDDGALIVSGPTGTDRLQGIESLRFGSDAPIEVTSLGSMNLIEEMVVVSRGGVTTAAGVASQPLCLRNAIPAQFLGLNTRCWALTAAM